MGCIWVCIRKTLFATVGYLLLLIAISPVAGQAQSSITVNLKEGQDMEDGCLRFNASNNSYEAIDWQTPESVSHTDDSPDLPGNSVLSRLLLWFSSDQRDNPSHPENNDVQLDRIQLLPLLQIPGTRSSQRPAFFSTGEASSLTVIPALSHISKSKGGITIESIRCLNEPDNLPCHKTHYINQVIQETSQNHQFIEIYPIEEELHKEQLKKLHYKAIQLTTQKKFYNRKGGVVDTNLYQSILDAMKTEFEQLIDNHVPADIAVEIITNNLVYTPDSQTAQCPDCDGEPIPCHLQQDQASAVAVPHFQHQPGCEFGSPDQCRVFDLDDWVKPKNTGGHTCECGTTIPSGVEGAGGMPHLISGMKNNIFCGRAARELKEQLSDPENICWQILCNLAVSVTNSHLAIPIIDRLISTYNATTIHQWFVAAQRHFPRLSLLIDHIEANHGIFGLDALPPAETLPPIETLTIQGEIDLYNQVITGTSPEDNPDAPTVFHTLTPKEIELLMEFTGMSEEVLNISLQQLAYKVPYTTGDISEDIIPINSMEDPRLNSLF